MKNKVLSIILCCLIVIGIMPVQALAAYSDDDVPYGYTGIYTAEDLNNVRNNLSGRYALMADIDLTEATAEGGSLDCGYGWLPIGDTSDKSFSGIFLGRNHTITGLRIAGRTADYSGLFGRVSGTVKDLNLKDVNISAKNYVGGIAGYTYGQQSVKLSNINVSGSISGSENVGGLVGYINSTASNVNVSGLITGLNCVGGISGFVGSGELSKCSNFADVNAKSSAGGIVGYSYGSKMVECYNKGSVTADIEGAGGIIGWVYSNISTVSDCYNMGVITSKTSSSAGGIVGSGGNGGYGRVYRCINLGNVVGGAIVGAAGCGIFSTYYLRGTANSGWGNGSDSYTISLSPEQMKYENSFYGFDFDNVWVIDLGSDIKHPQLRNVRETEDSGIVIEPEKHDDVFPDGYKGIYNVQDLYTIRNDMESNYILMRDIDLTEATAPGGDYDYNGQGWLPIARDWVLNNGDYSYKDVGFSGIFDGNGHTISGLRIEGRTVDNSGLFGYVEGGTIKNLNLKDINISAKAFTGGIAGKIKRTVLPNQDLLINCSFSGNIKGTNNVGGMAGAIMAQSYVKLNNRNGDLSSVKYCLSSGKVEGNGYYVGGLVGYLSYSAFSECYNKSNVYGLLRVGGICGYLANAGYVDSNSSSYFYSSKNENLYNIGNISGESAIGGICGGSAANYNISYTNCYNAGEINYVNSYGAITGEVSGENNEFYNCYYLKDSADTACSSTEISATVLTAEQMKQEDSFSGFDFNNIWIIDNDVDMKYPQLRNNMENPAEEISIKEFPKKLTYYHHEELDVSGLTITVKYKGLDGQSVKTVSADMVSGYDPEKVGEQTLTVNYLGAKTTFNVTVKELPVEEVIISENEMTLDIGKTAKLSASVLPANATNTSVLWSSSDPDVVRVDGNGNIAALKKGSAVITATASNGVSASCKVNVYLPAESVSLDKSELNLDRGETEVLIAMLKPITPSEEVSCGSESAEPAEPSEDIIWYSEDTSVADVNNGVVTAKGAGKTRIIVRTTRGKTASCDVNVYVSAKEVTIDPSVSTIDTRGTLKLTAKMSPSDTTDTLTWESSDESIATVSRDGVITPHKPGTVTISAKATHGAKAERVIIIKEHKHTSVKITGTPATCTKSGLTDGEKCSVCGDVIKAQKNIPALGHKEVKITGKSATCTAKGLTEGTKCSVCGKILKAQKEIPALGHKKVKIAGKSATCTEKGLTDGVKCSVCGKILTAQKEIPALGHKEVMIGIDSVTFSVNPDSVVDDVIPLKDGSSTASTEAKLVFDTSLDFENRTLTLDVSVENAEGHTTVTAFVNFPADKLEFVSAKDYDGRYLMVAGQTADSDNMVSAAVMSWAGFTENSIKIATYTFKVKDLGKPATCTENGFTEGTMCSVCGDIIKAQNEIPALGHKEVKIAGQAPTCTEKGIVDGIKCSVCGEILSAQKEIPALGHKEVKIAGKAATCTEKGISDGAKCSVCGKVLTEQKEIPALGHKEVKIEGKSATCTEKGLTDGAKCSVCGKVTKEQKEISALGHSYKDGVCTVCGEIDPNYKLILKSDSKLILNEEKSLIIAVPEKTNGFTAGEFKSQIDSQVKLDTDDNNAIVNGFKFKFGNYEYTFIIKGDVNADGKISAADARTILRIAAKLENPDEVTKESADINSDGKITSSEARNVLRFAAKLQSKIDG